MKDKVRRSGVSLVALLVFVVIVFLLQQVMIWLRSYLALEGTALKWMVVAHQLLTILLPVFVFLAVFRLPWKETLGFHAPPPIRTLIAVVGGVPLIYAINTVLPRLVPPTPSYTETTSSIVAHRGAGELILTIFAVCIMAPLADELFFRGLLLRILMGKYGKILAILGVGILTAMSHTLEPFKLIHAFTMGALFASGVVWTGSVWTSIILHALHNAMSLIPG